MSTPEVHELARKLTPVEQDPFIAGLETRREIVRPRGTMQGFVNINGGRKRSIGGSS